MFPSDKKVKILPGISQVLKSHLPDEKLMTREVSGMFKVI